MLDDLRYIHQVDKSDALGVAAKQALQLTHDYGVTTQAKDVIQNVVLGGMGGSAWPALMLRSWPGLSVPLEVSSNYTTPKYVNKNTLYIASSYSGNTEETIAELDEATQKGAQIVVMSAGGRLVETAKQRDLPLFQIPSGIQPRMSSFYFLAALVQILEPLGLVPAGSRADLNEAASWLTGKNDSWLADVGTSDNPAKQLAEKIVGKTAIIYSGPLLFPAANMWKICINESAKNLAWANQFPEFSHNEFLGWSSHPVEKPFAVIDIRSNLEHPRIQKRFDLTDRLLSGKRPRAISIEARGETVLQQLLWSFSFGDYVSIYLAILNNVDPTPVDLVEKFKAELG